MSVKVKSPNSFVKNWALLCPLWWDAWKNSQKSAVVGGGDGDSKWNEPGEWRQDDDAGEDVVGVAVASR